MDIIGSSFVSSGSCDHFSKVAYKEEVYKDTSTGQAELHIAHLLNRMTFFELEIIFIVVAGNALVFQKYNYKGGQR